VKITNHCIDPSDVGVPALINQTKVEQMLKQWRTYITVDNGNGHINVLNNTIHNFNHKEMNQNDVLDLFTFQAEVSLNNDKGPNRNVEISARLPDRTVKIKPEVDMCHQEEGTAWGSSAITVDSTTLMTTSTTLTSTSSTRTTTTFTTRTTTTRPCACFELCCESRPVEGVHVPVEPNMCPVWWQGKRTGSAWEVNYPEPAAFGPPSSMLGQGEGKLTGRAWEPRASGPAPSNVEDSLQTKKPRDHGEVDGSQQIAFAPISNEQNFFRKWSSSPTARTASQPRPWIAMGLLASVCAVFMQAVVIIRRSHARPSVRPDREAEDTHHLVCPDSSVNGCL